MKKVIATTLVIALASSEGLAKFSKSAAEAEGQRVGTQTGSQISGSSQQGQSVATTNYNSLQQSAANNLNNGQKGQATGMLLAGALAGTAAAYFGVCGGSGFTAYAACIAGGVLIGMSMQSKKAADSFTSPISDSWNNLCEYNSGGCTTTKAPNPYDSVVANNPQLTQPAIDNSTKILESKGFSVDPITGVVKTPDGKTVNPNDPKSLEAAMGAEAAGALMGQVAAAEKDAVAKADQVKPLSLAAMGFEGGGGGGGMGSLGAVEGYGDGSGSLGAGGKGLGGAARLRKPAQVSGLSKNFNGDPIGVAADSIFLMMSRRYNLKNTQKTFLGPEVK